MSILFVFILLMQGSLVPMYPAVGNLHGFGCKTVTITELDHEGSEEICQLKWGDSEDNSKQNQERLLIH